MTLGNDNGTDGQTDGQTDRVRRNMRPPPREEDRIKSITRICAAEMAVRYAALSACRKVHMCVIVIR